MEKKTGRIINRWLSLFLAAAILITMQGMPVLAEMAGQQAVNSRAAGSREMPKNPVHHCTGKDDGTDITDWSYVYFGSYPQTEITGDALTAEITGASYDGNGDAWVDGVKYHRASRSDANNVKYFGDSTYRYFKWERIKWKVLNNDGSTLFVVADKGLDCKDSNENSDTYFIWKSCTLRKWLNNDFYRTAFDGDEQGAIVEKTVVNEDYGTDGENETRDKVFLLSYKEVTNSNYGFCEKYDTDSVSRSVKVSDYARAMGANIGTGDTYRGNSWWLLRSQGNNSSHVAIVYYNGHVDRFGMFVNNSDGVCVPALHIDLSSDLWTLAEGEISDGQVGSFQLDPSLSGSPNKDLTLAGSLTLSSQAQTSASLLQSEIDRITWTSSDESIAKVTGVASQKSADNRSASLSVTVKSYKTGKATITGRTSNGITRSCEVTVADGVISEFTIEPSKKGKANKELSITGTVRLSDKAAASAALLQSEIDKITWTSSDKGIAEVTGCKNKKSADNRSASLSITIQPHKAGKVTITGKTAEGLTASCAVEISGDLKLKSVEYLYGDLEIDVLTTAHTIESNHRPFQLKCTPADNVSIANYALYSGNQKVAESASGEFKNVNVSGWKCGEDISVKVYSGQTETAIQLLFGVEKRNLLMKSKLGLGGSGLSLTLSEDVPFIGGSEISVNLPEIPVSAIVEDGKVKVGINMKEEVLYAANSYEGVTTTTAKKRKTLKQKFDDMKNTLYKTGLVNRDWEGYLQQKNMNATFPLMKENVKLSLAGYLEGAWSDTMESVGGELVLVFSAKTTFEKVMPVPVAVVTIPVTLRCDVTGEGKVRDSLKYDFIKKDFSANVKAELGVSLEPYAAVGISTLLSGGVYGKIKLGTDITLISSTGPGGVDDVYASGELGIKGYFASMQVVKKPFFTLDSLKETPLGEYIDSGRLLIYSREKNSLMGKKPVPKMQESLSDERYIWSKANGSVFLSAANIQKEIGAATLVQNAYGAAEPQILSAGGTTLVAYLDSDASRALPNQTVVKYVKYDPVTEAFSAPKAVAEDNTADYKPFLYTDGKDIYACYLDSVRAYPDDKEPPVAEYAKTFSITVAKYDAESDQFIRLGTVGQEANYCYMPALTATEEGLLLAWAENADGEIFGLTENNSVYYSIYSNGNWSTPQCLAEGLRSVTSLAAGKLAGKEQIAYCVDTDNDLSTTAQQLYFADRSGAVTADIKDSVSALQYIRLPGTNQDVLAFNQNGSVAYKNAVGGQTARLLEEGTVDAGNRFTVQGNRIYYLKTTEDNSRNVCCAIYEDGKWNSVPLTDEADYVDAFSVSGQKLVYILTRAALEADQVLTSSSIKYMPSTETHHLTVDYVDFDALSIAAGQKLELDLSIANYGTMTARQPVVTFYPKSNPQESQSIPLTEAIRPGESLQKKVSVSLPEDFAGAVYCVKVEEPGANDSRGEDTAAEVDLSKTELDIMTEYQIDGDNRQLVLTVSNDSHVSSSCTVKVTDAEGKVVFIRKGIAMPANESVELAVPVDGLLADGKNETVLTAEVSTEDEEYYLCNNVCEQRIWNIKTWKPVESVIPNENPGNGGTGTGQNPGSTGRMDIAKAARVTLSKASYTYNGKKKKPGVTVAVNGVTLVNGADYMVLYKNNTKVGMASVVVSGTGNYTGTVTKTFKIIPKGTSLSKKVTAKSKGFLVRWKKQAKSTDGYQLSYSTNKKFTKKTTVTKTVKKPSKTKLDVKKCKTKKKYFIRIRTYKTVKGKKYYSDWSKVRAITTK